MADRWTFHMPVRIRFGAGVATETGATARDLNSGPVLLVTDRNLGRSEMVAQVTASLRQAGLAVTLFDQVEPNPDATTVHAGAAALASAGAAAVVAVGGGSAMDAGKAIALLAANGGTPSDYDAGGRPVTRPGPPVITVPTVAGSGSEVTAWAIISDRNQRRKMCLGHRLLAPHTALADPLLTLTLPPGLTAASGIDALSHAIEAYTAPRAAPHSDALALGAMELLAAHLPTVVANGRNLPARGQVMQASIMAGLAFPGAGLGMVHALAHPLSTAHDLPHGEAVAVLLPHVLAYLQSRHPERLARVAGILGAPGAGLSPERQAALAPVAVAELAAKVGLPGRLGELGVTGAHLPVLLAEAVQDRLLWPPDATEAEGLAIYRAAL